VRTRLLLGTCAVAAIGLAMGSCTSPADRTDNPSLAARGTTVTTVKPSRQDLTNRLSLTGKVTINPVFGLVAPVAGQVRFLTVSAPTATPTRPTRVASVWANGKAHHVEVPAGATFAGRLVDDRATVTAGMPIVSAKHAGYGLVADIDGAQAYKIVDALADVRAQIKNGPGPFACAVLGTIAALPAGTVPDEPEPDPSASAPPRRLPGQPQTPSEPTGMRLVCVPPADVKLINGVSATVEVVTAKASNVLVLPVEAVAGRQGAGKVDVVRPDGSRETRDVVLGLSDGKVIEIRSGLTGDETIAVPGPNLPTAKPNNNGPGDLPMPGEGK